MPARLTDQERQQIVIELLRWMSTRVHAIDSVPVLMHTTASCVYGLAKAYGKPIDETEALATELLAGYIEALKEPEDE